MHKNTNELVVPKAEVSIPVEDQGEPILGYIILLSIIFGSVLCCHSVFPRLTVVVVHLPYTIHISVVTLWQVCIDCLSSEWTPFSEEQTASHLVAAFTAISLKLSFNYESPIMSKAVFEAAQTKRCINQSAVLVI